jgi:hypothetical protein
MAEDLTTIPNPDAAGIIPVFAAPPGEEHPDPDHVPEPPTVTS